MNIYGVFKYLFPRKTHGHKLCTAKLLCAYFVFPPYIVTLYLSSFFSLLMNGFNLCCGPLEYVHSPPQNSAFTTGNTVDALTWAAYQKGQRPSLLAGFVTAVSLTR